MSARLSPLVGLLRSEPAVSALLGGDDSAVAVADAARPFVLSGFGDFASSRVILVATPTGTEADRLAHDLCAFIDSDDVLSFPAWETLPFERVSPGIETMGRRLKALWRLRHDSKRGHPVFVIAPVKALVQRLASLPDDSSPIVISRGTRVDPAELVADLVTVGYRREYQVEHRGEVAVRGGIVDVFPSTEDFGVRIDCFGDEVDRLTEFDVVDQRSTNEVDTVEIFPAREFAITKTRQERAAELSTSAPFAREQFLRIAQGEVFDGIESFLPFLDDEFLLCDLLDGGDRIVLIEPRRMRDRVVELIDEEAALAGSLAETWKEKGAQEELDAADLPRLHAGFDRLLSRSAARVTSVLSTAERPETETVRVGGWPAAIGDATPIARRIGELVRSGSSVVVAAQNASSASRISESLEDAGVTIDHHQSSDTEAAESDELRLPGTHVVVCALDRGFVLEGAKVAVLAESDLTGRHRPHRVPKARSRPVEGFFDDLVPGDYVVHYVHGVARYGGMVQRGEPGESRDYLLLEYRGGDRVYVPSDQIDLVTPYTGGENPTLSRLNGREWQRQRSRARQAVRAVAD
ncbi:MAG TPA: CarD family transcriptional regulator, partial [Acidimicrobiales bacterium]|nr:CarD family transcriptional regulator [Acidimicrobiales bacterium]